MGTSPGYVLTLWWRRLHGVYVGDVSVVCARMPRSVAAVWTFLDHIAVWNLQTRCCETQSEHTAVWTSLENVVWASVEHFIVRTTSEHVVWTSAEHFIVRTTSGNVVWSSAERYIVRTTYLLLLNTLRVDVF